MIAGYQAALTHGFTTDFTTSRIVGDANTPVYGVQAYLKSLQPRPEITCNDTQSFNVATGAPIHSTPATFSAWSQCASTDLVAVAIDGTSGTRGVASGNVSPADASAAASGLIVFTNLHSGGKPQLKSYATTTQVAATETFNLGGVFFNDFGNTLYALSNSGKLYCFTVPATTTPATALTACSGFPYSAGNTVTYSTPFPTYATSGKVEHIYFGDDKDNINCVQGDGAASPGTKCWTATNLTNPAGTSAIGPVVVVTNTTTSDPMIYAGDASGRFFRITDTGSAPATGSTIERSDLCTVIGQSSPCAANWAVHGSPTIDFTSGNTYVTAAGYMFQYTLFGGTWGSAIASYKDLNTIVSTSTTVDGSTTLDHTNGYAYVAYAGTLLKVAYPFDGVSTDKMYGTTLTQTVSGSANYPIGYPLAYGPYDGIFLGTGTNSGTTGIIEQYTLNGTAAAAPLAAITRSSSSPPPYGAMIESGAVLDWASGNLYFGYDTGPGTSGGLVQYPTAASATPSTAWECPANDSLVSGACVSSCTGTGSPPTTGCTTLTSEVASAKCVSGGCEVNACDTNYKDCDGEWADGCEVDIETDPNNCGGCGNACPRVDDVPSCVNGACVVTCDPGFGNCSGTIDTAGCPSTVACGTGGCCGNTCSGGQVCSNGSCASTTQSECATEDEDYSGTDPVTVTCPTGLDIQAISFISFGTPNGSCGSFSASTSCDDAIGDLGTSGSPAPGYNEREIGAVDCYGKNSCSIDGYNSGGGTGGTFGDPCSGTYKRFYLQVECACPPVLSLCANGYQDGNETDVDCGGATEGPSGSTCTPSACAQGKMCEANSDCAAGVCECGSASGGYADTGSCTADNVVGTCGCRTDADCATGDCECGQYSGACAANGVAGTCGSGKTAFNTANATSAAQTWTVPAGCTTVFFQAWGAGGGGGRKGIGGAGGYVNGSFSVTPGNIIDVWVGNGGTSNTGTATGGLGWASAATTANGGSGAGNGTENSGGGGGLTTLTYGSIDVYVGAGGGGSDGNSVNDWGGPGGNVGGANGCGGVGGGNASFGGGSTAGTGGGAGAGDNGGTTTGNCPGAGGASNAVGVTLSSNAEGTGGTAAPSGNTLYDYTTSTSCNGTTNGVGAGGAKTVAGGNGCIMLRCEE